MNKQGWAQRLLLVEDLSHPLFKDFIVVCRVRPAREGVGRGAVHAPHVAVFRTGQGERSAIQDSQSGFRV
jgi:hypothetical protein